MDADVSIALPKIPYGGFPRYGFKAGLSIVFRDSIRSLCVAAPHAIPARHLSNSGEESFLSGVEGFSRIMASPPQIRWRQNLDQVKESSMKLLTM
jgi:hypothetical protein